MVVSVLAVANDWILLCKSLFHPFTCQNQRKPARLSLYKCKLELTSKSDRSIKEAVALASTVDQVILIAGLSKEWETEGQDRTTMDLPPHSNDLISAVLKANHNTVVVVQSGTPVSMPWIGEAKAVLHAWFGGNETGNAIADVIFGEVNPVSPTH